MVENFNACKTRKGSLRRTKAFVNHAAASSNSGNDILMFSQCILCVAFRTYWAMIAFRYHNFL